MGAGAIALLPVLALTVYHAGDRGTGILYAFRGAGIVLGPFLVRPFIREDDLRTVFWGIGLAFVVFGSSYAVVAWMPVIWFAGVFVLLGHLGGGIQWTLSTYALQLIVPDRIRGRIFAFDEALISLTIAASATLAGWIADTVNVRIVMLGLAGVTLVFAAAWSLATRTVRRALRPVPTAPQGAGSPSVRDSSQRRRRGAPKQRRTAPPRRPARPATGPRWRRRRTGSARPPRTPRARAPRTPSPSPRGSGSGRTGAGARCR